MIHAELIEWTLVASTVADGTRAAAAQGVSVTPGNNAYGSYVQAVAATTEDAHLLEVCINSNGISATARDALVTLGFDPAGGSAYGGLGGVSGNEINHLLASCAAAYLSSSVSGGVVYRFRVQVPSGTSIGAKASVNNATVGTLRVAVRLFRCSRPDLVRIGRFVRTFGAVPGSSCGTAITPGGASEGAYVEVGTLADTIFGWEVGLGVNSTTMTSTLHEFDVAVGDASNKRKVIEGARVIENVGELIAKPAAESYGYGGIGALVYVRDQAGPNAPTANTTAAVYGVGG